MLILLRLFGLFESVSRIENAAFWIGLINVVINYIAISRSWSHNVAENDKDFV